MSDLDSTLLNQDGANPAPSIADDDFLSADVTIEDRQYGAQFPIVQWVNGTPDKKKEGGIAYTGGFFISTEQGVVPPGFTPYTLVTKEGEEIEGFATRDLSLSVLRLRKSWVVAPDKGLAQRFAQAEYDSACEMGKPRGQLHVLVMMKGLDEPLCLTFRGFAAKGMAGQGKDRGVIPSFGQMVPTVATRLARKQNRKTNYPLCAFYLTVGGQRDDKGVPVHTEVGEKEKSKISMPVWVNEPKAVDEAFVRKAFVGNILLTAHQAAYTESESWYEAWSEEQLAARRASLVRKQPAGAGAEGAAMNGKASTGLPGNTEVPF